MQTRNLLLSGLGTLLLAACSAETAEPQTPAPAKRALTLTYFNIGG